MIRSHTAIEELCSRFDKNPQRGVSTEQTYDGNISTNGPSVRMSDTHTNQQDRSKVARHAFLSNDGRQSYHGPTSLFSLFKDSQNGLDERLKAQLNNGPKRKSSPDDDMVTHLIESYRIIYTSLALEHPNEMSNDGLPLGLPPRAALEALFEPFFILLNPVLPIFRKETTTASKQLNYAAPEGLAQTAWVLAFTCIIIQILSVRPPQTGDPNIAKHDGSTLAELLKPFLVNSRRALLRMDTFMTPRLINVQALVSFVSGACVQCAV